MKLVAFILIFSGLVFGNAAFCQDDWVLKKEKNGIRVFARKSKNFKYDELKVECVFDGRLSQVAAVLLDVNNHSRWAYKTVKSQLVKKSSATDVYFYTEIECPWPFENRDLVVRQTLMPQPGNQILTIVAANANGVVPEKKKITRVKYSKTTWTLIPHGTKQCKVDYRIQIDLGEGVPAWLLNMFSVNGPYETFMNLKARIKLPQYANPQLPFAAE